MRTSGFLLTALGLAALSARAEAQYQFDVIGFEKIQVPDTSLGLGSDWLILVNTGSVPIPMSEWSRALHYGELSAPVGGFDLDPAFAGVQTLAPGQALGAFDPVLTSQLRFGESFISALAVQFNLSAPWPSGTTQSLRWSFVLGDKQVSGTTQIEFTPNPTTYGVSAFRTSATPASASVSSTPGGCAGLISVRPRSLPSPFRIAPSSDQPVIGNRAFALDVRVNTPAYYLGVDLAPGSSLVAGCPCGLGLTSDFFRIVVPGNIVLPMPIPNQTALIGQQVYLQVAGLTNGSISTLTNTLRVVIGPRP